MDKRAELGEFLRSRRARLRPEDVGLTHYGGRRRVPGLRREELAQLAGVSVAYYTRLEQGQSQNASDAVLDAIARALNLDEGERAYLHGLARPTPAARRRPRPERIRPGVRLMIESFGNVPAMVIGRCTDALAWNRMAHALLAGHLDVEAPERPADRPNMARLLFLDPHTRELYADWRKKARDAVAYLRLAAGRYPDDPALTALVGELAMKSPEFAALWSAHPVGDCAYNTREYRHPLVGAFTLSEEVMPLPDDQGQRVMVWNAEPDSPSEAALRLLADLSTETTDRRNASVTVGQVGAGTRARWRPA
ncbi:helix-turn-helix transcriptional regulator [Actinoallomurus purpureus]|uniref:helix-turn-helix domain-containing protein n=1 Tax=Actinoallomurus purpureus TaxID=478114 RepID=UPI002093CDD4|nr:helix-turn-helix transcriptional regulator [Actinoallomurus purpureus]MCO6004613.1 helix-turn-helix transcriptional regulator [Actinoallomurus purpureus]